MEVTENLGIRGYKKSIKKSWIVLSILIVLLIGFILLGVSLGSANLSFVETMKALFGQGSHKSNVTVWNMRMPRVIGAVLAGAGLGLAGSIMQSCLRNPLASPSTIGVGSAATFGANLAIIGFSAGAVTVSGGTSITISNPYAVTITAFVSALIAVFLIMVISKFQNFSPESIILAGTALSAVFGAATAIIQFFGDEGQVAAAVFWTFGELGSVYWPELLIIFIVLLITFIFFMFQSWNYNAMVTGEDTARSLGVKTNLVRVLGLIFSTLLTAVIVSFVGMIGFIGLIAPQIMKRIIGNDHRFLIPATTLAGAIILLLADTLSRMIISPIVLPVGAITSLIGAPVFIFILIKGLRKR